MSAGVHRASPAMIGPRTSVAICSTDAKSPLLITGNPASIMSTLRRCNCRATSSFSRRFIDAPGHCSPSRKVVSKTKIFSDITLFQFGLRIGEQFLNVDVVVTSTNATKLTKLETEAKRIVRVATPEQEKLKAKQLSEKTHVDATLQGNYKFARTNFTTKTQRTPRQWF